MDTWRTIACATLAAVKRIRTAAALGLLAGFLATAYGYALRQPFFFDDYLFLEKTRGASLGRLLARDQLAYTFYRPWSRELHFAALQWGFGARPWVFHLANFALWLGVMGLYLAVARRV